MKLPFVFRVQSERQNNYATVQPGPECATMTRELCLEAENTYTPEMENEVSCFFFFWLMSIKYTVHSDKQEETTRYTVRKLKQRQPEKKNRAMKYSCDIFTDKLLELAALFGDFGERELALD